MRILVRLAIALGIALLLPFPGPHVDRYVPIASVLFRRDALEADAAFFVLAGVVIAVYTGVVSLLLLLIRRRSARRPLAGGSTARWAVLPAGRRWTGRPAAGAPLTSDRGAGGDGGD